MRKARGFTLIEILAALTMFAVVGGALLQLFDAGLRTVRKAGEHSHAVFLARSKLTELLADSHLRPGTLSGDFADGYRWQAVLSEHEDPERPRTSWLRPLDLTLTVTWGEPGDEGAFDLKSMCLTQADES